MSRTLGWIAATGLAVGFVSLSLAYMTGGGELERLLNRSRFTLQSCGDDDATGSASERRLAWAGGDAIDISLPASVRLRASAGDDVIVRGSPPTIAHVQLRGSRLALDCRSLAASRTIDVELPGRAFRDVRISGSARVTLENLSQLELTLTISGSGSARAQGVVDQLTATISGSGDARLADVALKHLTAKISGSGTIEAAPKDEADINISGSGNVKLLSRPARLKSHVSGSGRISQMPVEAADKK